MIRFPRAAPLLSLVLAACSTTPAFYEAQNLGAKPFNQNDLAANACGPAALLNSSRFGSPAWRKLSETPANLTDRERIRAIARGPAMRESSSLPGRARWSRAGINLSDLRDVANEIARPLHLPALSSEALPVSPIESKEAHLRRVHAKLARSLASGIPPLVSLRFYAKRNNTWTPIQAHFVTITSVPGRLEKDSNSFPVAYIDPLGGKSRKGHIAVGTKPGMDFFAEARFPDVTIGKNQVRAGEESILVASAVLGRF